MRKLFYILVATFMVASCCCNDNTENTPVYTKTTVLQVSGNTYSVYKVKLENHTYIMMTNMHRMGLEHDPECPYCKDNGFPEHKLETTDY